MQQLLVLGFICGCMCVCFCPLTSVVVEGGPKTWRALRLHNHHHRHRHPLRPKQARSCTGGVWEGGEGEGGLILWAGAPSVLLLLLLLLLLPLAAAAGCC